MQHNNNSSLASDNGIILFENKSVIKKFDRSESMLRSIAVFTTIKHNSLMINGTFKSNAEGIYVEMERGKYTLNYLFDNYKKIKGHKLTDKILKKLFTQCVSLLYILHKANILHMDIKSENIILMDDDTIKWPE